MKRFKCAIVGTVVAIAGIIGIGGIKQYISHFGCVDPDV